MNMHINNIDKHTAQWTEHLSLGGTTCLTLLVLYDLICFMRFPSCQGPHNLLHDSPLLKNSCVRQVVSDKCFPGPIVYYITLYNSIVCISVCIGIISIRISIIMFESQVSLGPHHSAALTQGSPWYPS